MKSSLQAAPAIPTAVRLLAPIAAATFGLAAILHLGVPIPLGVVTLREPRITDATIVEGLAGLGLAVSSYAVFTDRPWARWAIVGALGFAMAGVLVGIGAPAGRVPTTPLNFVYHRVMLAAMAAGLVLLLTPLGTRRADWGRERGDAR